MAEYRVGVLGDALWWISANGSKGSVMLPTSMARDVASALNQAGIAGKLAEALEKHWLAGIECDEERHFDNPRCACSQEHLGWHSSVGDAVKAWIEHVKQSSGDGD